MHTTHIPHIHSFTLVTLTIFQHTGPHQQQQAQQQQQELSPEEQKTKRFTQKLMNLVRAGEYAEAERMFMANKRPKGGM